MVEMDVDRKRKRKKAETESKDAAPTSASKSDKRNNLEERKQHAAPTPASKSNKKPEIENDEASKSSKKKTKMEDATQKSNKKKKSEKENKDATPTSTPKSNDHKKKKSDKATPASKSKKKRPWRNKVRCLAKKATEKDQRQAEKAKKVEAGTSAAEDDVTMDAPIDPSKHKKKKKQKKKFVEEVEKTFDEEVASEMVKKLESARFRFINEQLYTMDGKAALELFQEDPQAFEVYHEGYRNQAKRWPCNPVTVIIQWIRSKFPPNKDTVIADMGCGDAKIAESLGSLYKVLSFDLRNDKNENVIVCNMAKVPVKDGSVDLAVYCLSLMGTNTNDFFREANRMLKINGSLKIAEVASRFKSVKLFILAVQKFGFKFEEKRVINDYFLTLEFTKIGKVIHKRPMGLTLKPCFYKKR